MAWPTITVEAAFGVNPLTTPSGGQWVNITSYVKEISTKRGRQHELSRTEPGTLTLRLKNRDRRFDPTHSSGPYWPNLRPMTRVRFKAVHASTTYELAQGFVTDWGQAWPGRPIRNGGDAEAVVQSVDAFKVLSLYELDSYTQRVKADEPNGYWRLRDIPGSTSLADDSGHSGGPLNLTYIAGTLGALGPLPGGATAIDVGRAQIPGSNDRLKIVGNLTVEAYLYVPASITGNDFFIGCAMYQAFVDSSRRLSFRHIAKDGAGVFVITGPTLSASAWSHVAITRHAGERLIRFYVNGVLSQVSPIPTGYAWPSGSTFYVGADEAGADTWQGKLAHVAVYPRVLGEATIRAHAQANIDDTIGLDTGAHVTAVLDAIGWPSGERVIDTGSSTLQATALTGDALSAVLEAAEDSERGLLYVAGTGKITFVARHSLIKSPRHTSQATFGDDPAESNYADLVVSYDDADLWTGVVVELAGSVASVAVEDTSAAATYGPRILSLSGLLLSTEPEANDLANQLLTRYKAPQARPVSLTFAGDSASALWTQRLTRELGDRVTINRRPPGGGSTIAMTAIIEGIEHKVTPWLSWETTWHLTPADAAGYWLLGDATYSVLGTTTRPAF